MLLTVVEIAYFGPVSFLIQFSMVQVKNRFHIKSIATCSIRASSWTKN